MAHPIRPRKITGRSGASRAKMAASTAPAIAMTTTIATIGISTIPMTAPKMPNKSLKTRRTGKNTTQKRILNRRPTTAMTAIAKSPTTAIAARAKRMSMLSGLTRGDLLKFRRLKLVCGPTGRVGREVLLRAAQSFVKAAHGECAAAALAEFGKTKQHREADKQREQKYRRGDQSLQGAGHEGRNVACHIRPAFRTEAVPARHRTPGRGGLLPSPPARACGAAGPHPDRRHPASRRASVAWRATRAR